MDFSKWLSLQMYILTFTSFTSLLLHCPWLSFQAQVGWLQHDFGHLSVFHKSKWDHLLHHITIGFIKVKNAHHSPKSVEERFNNSYLCMTHTDTYTHQSVNHVLFCNFLNRLIMKVLPTLMII